MRTANPWLERDRSWLSLIPVLVLLGAALLGARYAGTLAKLAFVTGCFAYGWWAWRRSPALHFAGSLVLIAFVPLVRRMIDDVNGYDPLGLVLVGPLIALAPPVLESMRRPLAVRTEDVIFHVAVAIAIAWAFVLTLLQNDITSAVTGALKWGIPVAYGAALLQYVNEAPPMLRRARRDALVRAATRTFLIVLPLIGCYGIWQHIDPPSWDRLWLTMAPITSAGKPEPYEVRTYSTMGGPAVFATFVATGMFLVFTLERTWVTRLALLPAAFALFLSMYRTAWIALLVMLLVSALFAETRKRSLSLLLLLIVAGAFVLATPMGEQALERLQSLSDTRDPSGLERLSQYAMMWNLPLGGLVGNGFVVADTGTAGANAVDGAIIAAWHSMGIVFGMLCIAALVGALVRALATSRQERRPVAIALAALAAAHLIQIPLASVASSELGIIFWAFTSLAMPLARPLPRGP